MSFAAALGVLGRLCSAALFAAAPAAAQGDGSSMLPSRDIAITYRVLGAPAWAEEMRVSWLASEGRQRIEWPGLVRVTIVAHRTPGASFTTLDGVRSVFMLRAGEEPAVAMPAEPRALSRFIRVGAASYAGESCIVWRHGDGFSTQETCIADDGTVLRSVTTSIHEGRTQTAGLEATLVDYGPQDPARFRPPQGYRVVLRSAAPPPISLGR